MKKILKIIISSLILFFLSFKYSFAGKGTNCELIVDKATISQNYDWIKFEVYNPTDSTIILDGIKYFKGNEFWREYKDIVKSFYSKTDSHFTHYVKTDSNISFVLQCHILQIHSPSGRSVIVAPEKERNWAQVLIKKIFK